LVVFQVENQGAQPAVVGAELVGLGSLVGMMVLNCAHLTERAQLKLKKDWQLEIQMVLDFDEWE
jgi:hypothetical protein